MKDEKFKVLYSFRDLHDISDIYPEGKVYNLGSIYVRGDNTQKRIDELMGINNKIGRKLIEPIIEKIDYSKYNTTQLEEMAKDKGLKGYSGLRKKELIRMLVGG